MTYLANEHTDLYYSIVNAAILRVPQSATRREAKGILSYTERHHIIPKSMGGTDDYTNLVWLTAEEHLRVHLLLPKMVSEDKNIRKMTLAAVRMANPQSKTQKRIIGDNLIPEIAVIRKEAALLHSKYMSEKHQGSNNPFYGKKHTEQTKERQRIASANRVMTDQMRINYSNGRKTFYKNYPDRKPTGEKNPRFIDTVYIWENINTGELLNATRLEMTTKHPELKSNISQVINGKYSHVKGWRIVNPR
jgi:hypothetical protein